MKKELKNKNKERSAVQAKATKVVLRPDLSAFFSRKHLYTTLPLILLLLVGAVFSLKNFREPDLWWQLRTGEWILQNGKIPTTDVFSFTQYGQGWVNIKWLFEVIAYGLSQLTGPEGIFVLQLMVAVSLLVISHNLSGLMARAFGPVEFRNPPALLFTLLMVLLWGTEYRLNGRPEMFSHLFTLVFIWLYTSHLLRPSKRIFLIIPLQILWANMHEAFGLGMVLSLIFCASTWVHYLMHRENTRPPKALTFSALASIAGIVINPLGIKLLVRPISVFGQVFQNKFTTELADFSRPEFWQKEAWISIVLLVMGLGGLITSMTRAGKDPKKWRNWAWHPIFPAWLILLAAFAYLGTTAYRNLIFVSLAATPAAWVFICYLQEKFTALLRAEKIIWGINLAALSVWYVCVVTNTYYETYKRNDRYGLEVLDIHNPAGASKHIQKAGLSGNGFSDYLTSSYLMYDLKDNFKSYLDLRDLDVFSAARFDEFTMAVSDPASFEKLDSIHHFPYAVVYRLQFPNLHKHLYKAPNWSLAFIDGVAAVYVKTTSKTNTRQFAPAEDGKQGKIAYLISKLFHPLYQPFQGSEYDHEMMGAAYFLSVGEKNLALDLAKRSVQANKEKHKSLTVLAEVYYNLAVSDSVPQNSARLLDSCRILLDQSISIRDDFAQAHIDRGVLLFRQQAYKPALESFEKACSVDPSNINAHLFAAETYKMLPPDVKNAEKGLEHYLTANRLNPDNPSILLNIGLTYSGLGDCERTKKYLGPIVNYPGFSPEDNVQIRQALERCR